MGRSKMESVALLLSYSHERTAARDSVFLYQQIKHKFAVYKKKNHTNLKPGNMGIRPITQTVPTY